MKVIIAGGRSFNDFELFKVKVKHYLGSLSEKPEIIHGGCKGADALAHIFAEANELNVKVFNANWGKYGNAAGPIRNREMAEHADSLIAFWDGKSKGTKNMIDTAKELKLNIRIVKY